MTLIETSKQTHTKETTGKNFVALLMQLTTGGIEKLELGGCAECYDSVESYITILKTELPNWGKVDVLERKIISEGFERLKLSTGSTVFLRAVKCEHYEVETDWGVGCSYIGYGISF